MRRGQASIEYISLVALVLVLSVPMLMIFYEKSAETKSTINFNQAQQIAQKIADNAESIYYLGENAKTTLRITMPENVVGIAIGNREVTLNLTDQGRISEIDASVPVNITGNISYYQGPHRIVIESRGSYVEVSEE